MAIGDDPFLLWERGQSAFQCQARVCSSALGTWPRQGSARPAAEAVPDPEPGRDRDIPEGTERTLSPHGVLTGWNEGLYQKASELG